MAEILQQPTTILLPDSEFESWGGSLPIGAHNSIAAALLVLLFLWLYESLGSLLESRTLLHHLDTQGGCVLLKGMAGYTDDFKRLRRSHLAQILRLRRSLPAVVVPRVVVEFYALSCRSGGNRVMSVTLQSQSSSSNPARAYRAALFAGVPLQQLVKFVQSSTWNLGGGPQCFQQNTAAPPRVWRSTEERLEPLLDSQAWPTVEDGGCVVPAASIQVCGNDDKVSIELHLSDEFAAHLNSRNPQVYLFVQDTTDAQARDSADSDARRSSNSSSCAAFAYGLPVARTVALVVKLTYQKDRTMRNVWNFNLGSQVFFSNPISRQPDLLSHDVYYDTFASAAAASRGSIVTVEGEDGSNAAAGSGLGDMAAAAAVAASLEQIEQASMRDAARGAISSMHHRLYMRLRPWLTRLSHTRRAAPGEDLFSFSPAPVPPAPQLLEKMYKFGLREIEVYGLENESESDCLICMAERKQTVLLPCGHSSCCNECLGHLRKEKCPVCRASFQAYLVIPMLPRRASD